MTPSTDGGAQVAQDSPGVAEADDRLSQRHRHGWLAARSAALLTALSGVAFVAVGAVAFAQGHGRFSWGVGSVLVVYGLLVMLLAILLWRRVALAQGLVIASSLLHIGVLWSVASGEWAWLVRGLILIPLAAVVACLLPATREVLEQSAPTQ